MERGEEDRSGSVLVFMIVATYLITVVPCISCCYSSCLKCVGDRRTSGRRRGKYLGTVRVDEIYFSPFISVLKHSGQ